MAATDEEHQAALEILLLVALADRMISKSELDQIERDVDCAGDS